jgi:5-methyltetrahydrofolate--homocysteine methyltransferase
MRVKDAYLQSVLDGRSFLLFDGAMGTMLQAAGLAAGDVPELLNFSDPEAVMSIHRAYVEAGSQVVTANTFGANARKLDGAASVEQVFSAAVSCARASGARYVAADIGPTGGLLKPLGTMDFDEAYDLFAEQARAADVAGADVIAIETMADLLEMKAAVLAAKEESDLPIFATMTFGEDGCTFLGTSPETAAITLSALGVQALGINCSLGPDALAPLAARMAALSRVPVMVQANAGLPQVRGGQTVYDIGPQEYAGAVGRLIEAGASIVGGCCGTDPSYICELTKLLEGRTPLLRRIEPAFSVCSAQNAVILPLSGKDIAVIGERINPTGKPRLKEALRSGNLDYAVGEAIDQQEAGADILDMNVGLPEIDEPETLVEAMELVQSVCPLPLQIDSSDIVAIERAARRYCGKPIINSVNAKQESLETVLPVARRYGCAVVGLTLDEAGIPDSGDARFELAVRIVEAAESQGIPREDIAIDCLAMAASTNQATVSEILHAIKRVKVELGVKTVLGVSNISFGLPQRELVNAVFLANALGAGLDLPILNPLSARYRDVVAAYRVLNAQDEGARDFIACYSHAPNPYDDESVAATGAAGPAAAAYEEAAADSGCFDAAMRHLILTGRKADVPQATRVLLETHDPLEVIDGCFIPALDEVGAKFEAGEFFLPQLMASAEAVKAGFDVVKAEAPAASVADKGTIAVATVKGDIHDIGKNIVKMLLENYGYTVIDLGRDAPPEAIVAAVKEKGVRLVGLSALMTTTVRAMEETIQMLHREVPDCKIMVGGAVLNPEYAKMVGADFYGKDAAESARIAERFFSE